MENVETMRKYLRSLGIEVLEIKPPINSDVFCIELSDYRWGAMRMGQEQPNVEFVKYKYMFRFDGNYCLVNMEGRSGQTHRDRGIINSQGVEAISPYFCDTIYDFYNKGKSYIKYVRNGWEFKVDKNNIHNIFSKTQVNM